VLRPEQSETLATPPNHPQPEVSVYHTGVRAVARNDTPTRRRLLTVGAALVAGSVAGCSATDPTATGTETATTTPTESTTAGEPTTTSTETATPTGGTVETLVSVPGERVPENMAFDAEGDLYFGITAGEVRRLDADRTNETGLRLDDTELVATLPGAIGVETGPDGTIYVAVPGGDDGPGVWAVPSDGEPSRLVGIDGFPNDLTFDAERDRLLVTESQGGVVYAVGTDGSRTTWLDDDRLDTESFGANGIASDAVGNVYVAVTRAANETGRLLRVPVADDGSAGEATTFFDGGELFGADGITVRGGDVYVAANSQNRVVRVASDGETTVVADAEDGLVFPSDVLFGPGEMDDSLFVCNFANQSPDDGAILRMRV